MQFFPDDSVIFRSGHQLSHGLALSLPVIPKNPFLNLDDCAVVFEQAPYCQEVSTTHPMALHFCHSLWSCQLADRQGRCHFFLSCVIVYCFTLSALLQLECRLLVCAVEHLSAVVSMEHWDCHWNGQVSFFVHRWCAILLFSGCWFAGDARSSCSSDLADVLAVLAI